MDMPNNIYKEPSHSYWILNGEVKIVFLNGLLAFFGFLAFLIALLLLVAPWLWFIGTRMLATTTV